MYKLSKLKIPLIILMFVVTYNAGKSQVITEIPLYDNFADYKNEIHLYDAGGIQDTWMNVLESWLKSRKLLQ